MLVVTPLPPSTVFDSASVSAFSLLMFNVSSFFFEAIENLPFVMGAEVESTKQSIVMA